MSHRKQIHWKDLPAERRRRLVVILGELIQRRLSSGREGNHEDRSRGDAA